MNVVILLDKAIGARNNLRKYQACEVMAVVANDESPVPASISSADFLYQITSDWMLYASDPL